MNDKASVSEQILSEEDVQAFHQNGYVVARGLWTPREAVVWKDILKRRLAEEGMLNEPSGVRVWMADAMDPVTQREVTNQRLLACLQQLIGPHVEFLSVKAVFKDHDTDFASPWHQDWFYWQGATKISAWIALDDAVPENVCLQIVPGRHRRVFEKKEVDDGKGFGHRVDEQDLAGLSVETVPVQRGDTIFFHDLAMHGSHPNTSGTDRWSAIATYRDGSQLDSSTVWKASIVMSGECVNVSQAG